MGLLSGCFLLFMGLSIVCSNLGLFKNFNLANEHSDWLRFSTATHLSSLYFLARQQLLIKIFFSLFYIHSHFILFKFLYFKDYPIIVCTNLD